MSYATRHLRFGSGTIGVYEFEVAVNVGFHVKKLTVKSLTVIDNDATVPQPEALRCIVSNMLGPYDVLSCFYSSALASRVSNTIYTPNKSFEGSYKFSVLDSVGSQLVAPAASFDMQIVLEIAFEG